MSTLKDFIDKCDNNKILSSLVKLRKLSKGSAIDRTTYVLLVDLIKMPNAKILNYSLSLLANWCTNDIYRTIFVEVGGIPHLILILKTIDNDQIICRACRLVGNLAINREVAKQLCVNQIGSSLLSVLEKYDNLSSDSLKMAFRATKKLCVIPEFKWKETPENLMPLFTKCLNSEDDQDILLTLRLLNLLTDYKCKKNGKFKANKELFLKLIDLTKNPDSNYMAMSCLSNLICYHTSCVWSYLEGSQIAEVFIEYLQKVDTLQGNIFQAFHKLCTEVAVRNKVRLSGLLTRLVDLSNPSNEKKVILTFYLFQYDLISMTLCSKNPKFISIIFNTIKLPEAVQILTVLSRLTPPVKELVSNENLSVIIKNKMCHGILKNISRTNQFLKPLLLSGKVWEIEKAGFSLEYLGSLPYIENLLIELLSTNEKQKKEDVSLAVPFLLKPSDLNLLCKLLLYYQVMETILLLFKDNPLEEKVLASIIRLIYIFKQNFQNPGNFFGDLDENQCELTLGNKSNEYKESQSSSFDELESVSKKTKYFNSTLQLVIFELDTGVCVSAYKNLLCENSPVFNSMLQGHFIEAKQEKVRLQNCSEECFKLLVNLLQNNADLGTIPTKVYLELLSITDRFLLNTLNTNLTNNLKIDKTSCGLIYEWYRKAGCTKNNSLISQKLYEFLFQSADNLLLAMRTESCKKSLVDEISQYLSNLLTDLQ